MEVMPPKKAGGIGGAGKRGSGIMNEKQERLSTEDGGKKVTFMTSSSREIGEVYKQLKEQVRLEVKMLREKEINMQGLWRN